MTIRWGEALLPLVVSAILLVGAVLSQPQRHPWLAGTLGVAGVLLLAVTLVFFRDPERSSAAGREAILSPADGRVVAVEDVIENRFFQGPARRVAIFMHLGNVHVQRVPSPARLLWIRHQPGIFRPAFDPQAASVNEQCWYAFEGVEGKFAVVQIAGLIARRTRSWIRPGKECARGERLGMIRFGSEVDCYFPQQVAIRVKKGDKVRAGKSVLGEWR